MSAPQYHDTPDIVIAATRWLMRRYRRTGCRKLARMVEQHLRWMESYASNSQLADACRRLSCEWRAVSRTPEAVNATPQSTVH
ncbi:MAG: hypothetical protein LT080_08580 [Thiobacillus sp.]|nr:hypothetical protein [Thiobacillus sp.]